MYTIYGIIDPGTRLFVYVGLTNNFERRKSEHLAPPRTNKTQYRDDDIKGWLAKAYANKVTPHFIRLDLVETEEQAVLAEKEWIRKLAEARYPLLNRWEEHLELIEPSTPGLNDKFEAFWPGKWHRIIATMTPTPKGAGYSLTFPEETIVRKGNRLVILPKREGE